MKISNKENKRIAASLFFAKYSSINGINNSMAANSLLAALTNSAAAAMQCISILIGIDFIVAMTTMKVIRYERENPW